MVFIRETNIQEMNEDLAASSWGIRDMEWPSKKSEGVSGRMITTWR